MVNCGMVFLRERNRWREATPPLPSACLNFLVRFGRGQYADAQELRPNIASADINWAFMRYITRELSSFFTYPFPPLFSLL